MSLRVGVRRTRSKYLVAVAAFLAVSALLFVTAMRPRLANAAHEYRYHGLDGVYSSVRERLLSPDRPNIDWPSAAPESQGMNGEKLSVLNARLAAHDTSAFIVVRGNRIVHEWYAPGGGPNARHSVAAIAKAVAGTMALLVALDEGRIGLEEPAANYIRAWAGDPVRSKITVGQLASHTSGLYNVPYGQGLALEGWQRRYDLDREGRFALTLSDVPLAFEPGTRVGYSSPGYYALSYALTASLRGAPEADMLSLLERRVMEPLGVPSTAWRISYGESYGLDGMQLYTSASGAEYTPRALARIGQLMLQGGRWDGKRLVSLHWVHSATAYRGVASPGAKDAPAYGLGWMTNTNGYFRALPRDAYFALGAGHQVLLVVPSLDLVAVRTGTDLERTDPAHDPERAGWALLEEHLFAPLMETVVGSELVKARASERPVGGDGLASLQEPHAYGSTRLE